MMTLLLFMAAAMTKDRQTCRIPNLLLAAGAVNGYILRFFGEGWTGMADAAVGTWIPLILCGWLFALSMLGAGDIKLLMTAGIYLGTSQIVRVCLEAFMIGAGLSLVRLVSFHQVSERVDYFMNYLCQAVKGRWQPYVDMSIPDQEKPWLIHFSVPILLAVVFEILFMSNRNWLLIF